MAEFIYPVTEFNRTAPNLVEVTDGYVYENILTRVSARITGSRLHVPVPRPAFTALELATALQLPADFQTGWSTANQTAAAVAGSAPRLHPEQGREWWRYMCHKHALRLAWPTMDVAILDLLLFQHRPTSTVARVLVWPERTSSLVIPAAADYLVAKKDALVPGQVQQRPGLVDVQTAVAHLGERAQFFAEPVPHWLYRGGDAHMFLIRSLRNLTASPATEFSSVRPDQVVDEPTRD